MASKKNVRRAKSGRSQELELARLRKLSRRAWADAAKLLAQYGTGTITRVDLQLKLKQVARSLRIIDLHFYKL